MRAACRGTTQILRSDHKWTVTAVAGLLLLVVVMTANRPFSAAFWIFHSQDGVRQTILTRNQQRTQATRNYFQTLPKLSLSTVKHDSSHRKNRTSFAIAIVTVNRKIAQRGMTNVSFVLQSAAALNRLVKGHATFRDSVLFVCNVDRDPGSHGEAMFLKDYILSVERYGSSAVNTSGLADLGSKKLFRDIHHRNMYDQELFDYMFCMQAALLFDPEYVLMVEDDAVPTSDVAGVLQYTLSKIAQLQTHARDDVSTSLCSTLPFVDLCPAADRLSNRDPNPSNREYGEGSPASAVKFAFLKLYYPERWQGFAFEIWKILELASFGVVGGGVCVFLRTCIVFYKPSYNFGPPGRSFALGFVLLLVMAVLSGRQNIDELRRVSRYLYRLQESPSCCTPAMLYPVNVIPTLLTWLSECPSNRQVDLCLADFVQRHKYRAYSVEPNVFRHVGIVTSLSQEKKKPIEEFLLL